MLRCQYHNVVKQALQQKGEKTYYCVIPEIGVTLKQ